MTSNKQKKSDLWRLILQVSPCYPARKRNLSSLVFDAPRSDGNNNDAVKIIDLDTSISGKYHIGTPLSSEKTRLKLAKDGITYVALGKLKKNQGIASSHILLEYDRRNGNWHITDISKRGMLINGVRVQESSIHEGDSILIGGASKTIKPGFCMKANEIASTGLMYVAEKVFRSMEDSVVSSLAPSEVFRIHQHSENNEALNPSETLQTSQNIQDSKILLTGPGSDSAFQHFHILCTAAYMNLSLNHGGRNGVIGISPHESLQLFQQVIDQQIPFNLWDNWIKSHFLSERSHQESELE